MQRKEANPWPFFLDEVTSLSVLTQLSGQADGCGRVEPGGRADGQAILAFTEGSAPLGLPLVLMRGRVGFLLNFRSQAGVSAVACGWFEVPKDLHKENEFIGFIQGHMV